MVMSEPKLPEYVEEAFMLWRGGCECDEDRMVCPACEKRLDDTLRRAILRAMKLERAAGIELVMANDTLGLRGLQRSQDRAKELRAEVTEMERGDT
jgi:hypothetical protein